MHADAEQGQQQLSQLLQAPRQECSPPVRAAFSADTWLTAGDGKLERP